MLRFLPELNENVQVLLEEDVATGKKSYILEGPYIETEIQNRNKRFYPFDVISGAAGRFNEQFIKTNRALGELGHPATSQINLDRVSHMITSLKESGTVFMGRSKLLDTPCGKIAKNFVDEGVKLGVSTRGFGSVTESRGVYKVGSDFHLSTVDIVADPSGPNCFVNAIMENKEFYIADNGMLLEATQDYINDLSKTRQLTEANMLKVFESFCKGLK